MITPPFKNGCCQILPALPPSRTSNLSNLTSASLELFPEIRDLLWANFRFSFYPSNQLLLPRRHCIWIPSRICPENEPITGRLTGWTDFQGLSEQKRIWSEISHSSHPRGCDVITTGRGVPPGCLTQNFPGALTAANRLRCLIRRGQSSHPIPAWATLHHAMLADLSTHWPRFGCDKSLEWTCGPAPPTGTEKLEVNRF